jgi:hypothetical protein
MKNFARCSCIIAAQIGQSSGAENNGRHAAAASYRAAGIASGNEISGPGRPGPDHLEIIQAMHDCENPKSAGNLAGESYAAVLENHPRYPSLRRGRDRALFERLDDVVSRHIDRRLLLGFGFDEIGIVIYRAAALTAFRAARPTI